ncbi:hypothetical protein [Pseudohalioglobus lutimaris]|uniref:Uncharacterized protein n=1 Tax=Pseudohalioglobus lutimaris TaxID=1737061 RepID=A0A2N5X736_9GAMM|nr:hypothetical protein [Pseudohalioglobus lutimaris]PLW70303.1 hypothetical protein C0039_03605 [Pseudohalioglobus lutimaris]
MQVTEFNPSELCSRKLWQLVNDEDREGVDRYQLQQAIEELASRRHYLAELTRTGKLQNPIHKN